MLLSWKGHTREFVNELKRKFKKEDRTWKYNNNNNKNKNNKNINNNMYLERGEKLGNFET